MPSSEPLEMMIETLWIGSGCGAVASSECSSSAISVSLLDAAARLGNAGDLGRELRRALGEQLIELLDRHARELPEGPDRRGRAVPQIRGAHEVDHRPVPVGQLV